MKATEQKFTVMLFIMLYKVVLPCKSVEALLKSLSGIIHMNLTWIALHYLLNDTASFCLPRGEDDRLLSYLSFSLSLQDKTISYDEQLMSLHRQSIFLLRHYIVPDSSPSSQARAVILGSM